MRTASSKSLIQPVYDQILDQLMNKKLKPGERISEGGLAEQFGVSRTPVREALRLLEADGLINIHPNKYIEVISFTPEMIENIGVMRISLDTMSVRFAIFRGSNEDFQRLRDISDRCSQALISGAQQKHSILDCEFHTELTRIAGNPILLRYQTQLLKQMQFILAWRHDLAATAPVTHDMILDAMIQRDETEAVRLVTSHLTDFYQLDRKFPFLLSR